MSCVISYLLCRYIFILLSERHSRSRVGDWGGIPSYVLLVICYVVLFFLYLVSGVADHGSGFGVETPKLFVICYLLSNLLY